MRLCVSILRGLHIVTEQLQPSNALTPICLTPIEDATNTFLPRVDLSKHAIRKLFDAC